MERNQPSRRAPEAHQAELAVIYFQVSTRRLQIRVEELETKICMLLAELGNKNVEINRLRRELVEKIATILTLQARGTSTCVETNARLPAWRVRSAWNRTPALSIGASARWIFASSSSLSA